MIVRKGKKIAKVVQQLLWAGDPSHKQKHKRKNNAN